MKEPKKALKILDSLEHLSDLLSYFYQGNRSEFKALMREHIAPIDDYIRDLSLDEKIKNARLAEKIKDKWDSEQKEKLDALKEKIEELKENL